MPILDSEGFNTETPAQWSARRRKERKLEAKAKRDKKAAKDAKRTNKPDMLAESKGSTANLLRSRRESNKTLLDLFK